LQVDLTTPNEEVLFIHTYKTTINFIFSEKSWVIAVLSAIEY
jgi:hypothetical protein